MIDSASSLVLDGAFLPIDSLDSFRASGGMASACAATDLYEYFARSVTELAKLLQ